MKFFQDDFPAVQWVVNRPLFNFRRGVFETDDPQTIEMMKAMGIRHEETEEEKQELGTPAKPANRRPRKAK